jgi:hypothetical protein
MASLDGKDLMITEVVAKIKETYHQVQPNPKP